MARSTLCERVCFRAQITPRSSSYCSARRTTSRWLSTFIYLPKHGGIERLAVGDAQSIPSPNNFLYLHILLSAEGAVAWLRLPLVPATQGDFFEDSEFSRGVSGWYALLRSVVRDFQLLVSTVMFDNHSPLANTTARAKRPARRSE